jgi:multidrug efflux pump subunit AcrA (membrane-fusion protein)
LFNVKKFFVRIPIILAVGGAATYAVFHMSEWVANKNPASQFQINKVVAVSAAAAETKPIRQSVPLTGVVQSKDNIDITPTTGGTVTALQVDVGQQVKAGDVLAVLDSTVQQSNLAEAQANLKSAIGKLNQQNHVSDDQIDIAQQNVQLSQIKLDQLLNGPSEQDIAKAKMQVENAQKVLDSNKQYEQMESQGDSTYVLAIRKAQQTLQAVKEGTDPTSATYRNTQSKVVADLDSSRQNLDSVTATGSSFAQAVRNAEDDLRGAQQALASYQQIKAQAEAADPKVAEKNALTYDSQLANLQKAVVSAQDDLAVANANWTKAVSSATQSYNSTQYTSQAAMDLALRQKEQALQNAQNALDTARANMMEAVQKAHQSVVTSENNLSVAQMNLQTLLAPPDEYDVATAKANLAKAQSQLNLIINPDDEGNLESLQAAVDAAQARVNQAQEAVNRMTITAPFSGTVTARNVSVGSTIQQSRAMFTIMSDHLTISAQVDQQHLGAIRSGNAASFTLASAPDQTFNAKVEQVSPTANVQTLTFNVLFAPTDKTVTLIPGETVSLEVVTRNIPKALMIPTSAIVNLNGHPQVFVINDKSVVSLKDIDIGYSDGAETQVTKGLKEGQNVVTMGQTFLGTGDKVQISTDADTTEGDAEGEEEDGAGKPAAEEAKPKAADNAAKPEAADDKAKAADDAAKPKAAPGAKPKAQSGQQKPNQGKGANGQ